MRNRLFGLVSAVVLASTMATSGCNSGSSGGGAGGTGGSSSSGGRAGNGGSSSGGANGNGGISSGGSSGNGGISSGGSPSGGAGSGGIRGTGGSSGTTTSGGSSGTTTSAPTKCPNVTPCGGELVGTWKVSSSCLVLSGDMDGDLLYLGCPKVPVTGSLETTGTWTAKAGGAYTDNTITTGSMTFALPPPCLVLSSTPVECSKMSGVFTAAGWATAECANDASGECQCSATANQTGGIGVIYPLASDSGNYTTSGNGFNTDGSMDYSYCVSGNTLTMTPKSTVLPLMGTVVLQKSGAGGATGGAGGVTGQGGSGGKSGAGGTGGSGGAGGAAGSGGTSGAGGAVGSGGTSGAGGTTGGSTGSKGPCDIYAAANNPCVAAHSTVRALFGAYSGKLYQVRRSDNTTKDILTLAAGGIADTAPQDTFCSGSTCVLTVVYDQSTNGNDLWYQGSTQVPASTSSSPAKLTDSVSVGGHKVYSVYISPGNCYWHDGSKSGMATGAQPEGMYMVTSSRHANGGCCFDYGNSETDRSADGSGAMDSLNFSSITAWGTGAGSGPWVMADLEYGVFAEGDTKKNSSDPTQTAPFVTAVLRNDGTKEFALRGGDATTGSTLSTYYKGALPGGWSPMKKQGALILGCGGDCCKPSGGANASAGIFFEGAIVTGYPTDATEDAIQVNIVAAGYGK